MSEPVVIEVREDGRKFGWLGHCCQRCNGTGEDFSDSNAPYIRCNMCGGTGEAYGEIKTDDK